MTGLPPGPRVPGPVQALGWFVRPVEMLERWHARYGDIFTLRLGGLGTSVLLADPRTIAEVFAGDPTVLHAGEANAVAEPLLGPNSVLVLDEDAHLRERRLLLPPFHGERLAALEAIVRDTAQRHIASWPRDRCVATRPLMQELTLEIIMRAVFGVHDEQRQRVLHRRLVDLLDWLMRPRNVALGLIAGPQALERVPAFRNARANVDALIAEEIAERRANGVEGRHDVLTLLLEARDEDGQPLAPRRIRDHLVTMLGAGHETTATSLAWACAELARAPEVVAGIRVGDDELLDATVREVLRLRPVVPGVGRRLTRPLALAGYMIPAGVSVSPAIHLVHRRPDIYPDPHRFRPARHLEGRDVPAYGWIPFGGGVRRCLGAGMAQLELRVTLEELCRTRELLPGNARPESTRRRGVTLAPSRDGAVAFH